MASFDSNNDLDNKSLIFEAEQAVKEAEFGVHQIKIASSLPKHDSLVYLNIETKERNQFCVELTASGFRVG